MAKNSKIEWTDHTFNPWWGCVKLSPACKHCYAETWARRVGQKIWGADSTRRFFGDQHWKAPLTWNEEAKLQRTRHRVFCASMADVFEDRRELDIWRSRLWQLIDDTQNLDWLLLTKRPENIAALVPWHRLWPENVWLGTTVENNKYARRRIPFLVRHPARVLFLSCEPLLGPIDLTPWIGQYINWVIVGGESGGKSRPTDPNWIRRIRDQCLEAHVPFHFKQWGNWVPAYDSGQSAIRVTPTGETLVRLSKARAGRLLDGLPWDGSPAA